jgi:hypothetical protein
MGTRLRWLVLTFVGVATGGVVGLLLFLAWRAVPDVPLLLVGLFVGVLLGFSAALAVAVRVLSTRKKGGWALVFLPLTILAAPLLLLGAGYDAIKSRKRHRAPK